MTSDQLPLDNLLYRIAPVLRPELVIRAHTFGGKPCYVVEDPASGRFFRMGMREYAFVSQWDGRRTIEEVLCDARQTQGGCGFTPADAVAMYRWALRSGLVPDDTLQAGGGNGPSAALVRLQRRGGCISPLFLQIPLFHPDRFIQRLEPFLAWCFSWPALMAWLVVVGWALRDVVTHYHRLSDASTSVLAAGNWIWLGIAWVLLKVIHECGHAIACRRFGGEVREAGVILILLAPLAYVDVTSSWRLRSKWARMAVAAAGMYVEIFLAAVATITWARLAPGEMSQVCLNVMTIASVMTVLFNGNPLMRFDGYYILSDFLELPNLYTTGQLYVRSLMRRVLFGMRSVAPVCQGGLGVLVRFYGVASLVWRNVVFLGLILTAATLLQGAGIVLSVIAIVLWIGTMLRRFVSFARGGAGDKPHWLRFAWVSGAALGLILFCLVVVPWPGAVTAPAVVRYASESVVRAQCDGFVREICVSPGVYVEPGDVLVVMANTQVEYELAELAIEIKKAELKRRVYQRQGEMAKCQAEAEQLRALARQYGDKQAENDNLVVRAPHAGKVIARNLEALLGRYRTKGSHLLSIGDEAAKEVRLSIAQQDMLSFRDRTGQITRVYLSTNDVLCTNLIKVEPRATAVPLDMSLCAPNGGALAVRRTEGEGNAAEAFYELLSPRFVGIAALSPRQSEQVRAGQRAVATLRAYETVGSHLYRQVTDWIDRKLHRRAHRLV